MKTCPHCKSQDVREYYIDEMRNELNQEQVNDLTTHEKEIAAQCSCNDCGYTDAAEYFPELNYDCGGIFGSLAEILRPLDLNLSMKKVW